MSDLFEPSVPEMIAEVERELKQRQFVYPRLVASGKLTQAKADRQTAIMTAIVGLLRRQG